MLNKLLILIAFLASSVFSTNTLRVLLLQTDSAIVNITHAKAIIADLQQTYDNSGISIDVQLAGFFSTSYDENGTYNQHLDRAQNHTDGKMDNLDSLRDRTNADVVVVLMKDTTSQGLTELSANGDLDRSIAMINQWSSDGTHTIGHEIGHMFDVTHYSGSSPASGKAYGYAHCLSGNTRTVTDAFTACNNGVPANFYSDPDEDYPSTSDARGNSNTANAVRRINDTKAGMVSLNDIDLLETIRDAFHIQEDEFLNLQADSVVRVSADFNVYSGGEAEFYAEDTIVLGAGTHILLGGTFMAKIIGVSPPAKRAVEIPGTKALYIGEKFILGNKIIKLKSIPKNSLTIELFSIVGKRIYTQELNINDRYMSIPRQLSKMMIYKITYDGKSQAGKL